MKRLHALTAVAAASLLAACGGGSDDNARGAIKETPQTVATLSAAQLDAAPDEPAQPATGSASLRLTEPSAQLYVPHVTSGRGAVAPSYS